MTFEYRGIPSVVNYTELFLFIDVVLAVTLVSHLRNSLFA